MGELSLKQSRGRKLTLKHRLRDTEIDNLRNRAAVFYGDQNVSGLDVTMDDPFLMGMVNRLADLDKQIEPVADTEAVAITVVGDRNAGNPCKKLKANT